ncbi:hypothetical protein T8T21_00420 [Limimaricola variabilis]|uniref:hypothetical protein n=1 Tax=Limimaricola variabilis TaxID=1492771 RepID=UPI002AC92498|nr:hypothetical protein [Limimaricola variabilis]WPY94622.1 hypothetical protein T8T21_00420 [Limimaricola variabilis]
MTKALRIPPSTGRPPLQARFTAGEGRELAIVLPGLRNGCDRPLLQGTAALFERAGCDAARLAFDYAEDEAFLGAPGAEQFTPIAVDGRDVVAHLSAMRLYERVWLIDKSLGTLSMGAALSAGLCAPERTRAIWLTPSLLGTPLLSWMGDWPGRGLAVLGTEDPSNRPELREALGDSRGCLCTWWRGLIMALIMSRGMRPRSGPSPKPSMQ